MTRILQIGKSGQVATELTRAAHAAGVDLVQLGRPELDLTQPEKIETVLGSQAPFDVLVNCAAYTAVDQAETDQETARAVNALSVEAMGRVCAQRNAYMVHLSTDYVYAGDKATAYQEDDPTAPAGVYGATKLEGEERLRGVLSNSVILRTAWVYSAVGKNFVKTMLRIGHTKDALNVVDDQQGCPTSAADIADAILKVVQTIRADSQNKSLYGVFHYAGDGAVTWKGFAEEIFRQAAESGSYPAPTVNPIPSSEFPTPARRPANSVLNTDKIQAVYGIHPRPWRLALEEVMTQLQNEQA